MQVSAPQNLKAALKSPMRTVFLFGVLTKGDAAEQLVQGLGVLVDLAKEGARAEVAYVEPRAQLLLD